MISILILIIINFIKLRYVRSNCYILSPCSILRSFGIKISMLLKSCIYRCISKQFEISGVKIKGVLGYHFVATNISILL
ncbi:DUF261 family protein [Borrelia turicatae]|uniref:DUF261 family protein n=1 Tax=Borrelia turicatae TaxID=142 RepID=UPI0039BD2216